MNVNYIMLKNLYLMDKQLDEARKELNDKIKYQK